MSGSNTKSEVSAAAETVSPGDRKHRLVIALALVVLALDQSTKQWALGRLSDGRVIESFGSLRFNLRWNTGTAFSLGTGQSIGPWIAVLALVLVLWIVRSNYIRFAGGAVAAGLIAGGAVGNIADRTFRSGPYGAPSGFLGGAVVDFIDLQWWPAFNLADAGICCGAAAFMLISFKETQPKGELTASHKRSAQVHSPTEKSV